MAVQFCNVTFRRARAADGMVAPWTRSYLVPERPEPTAGARLFSCADGARVVVHPPSR